MNTMNDVIDLMNEAPLDEEGLGRVLATLETDFGLKVYLSFDVVLERWTAEVRPGNDLAYVGQGKSLQSAIIDVLGDFTSNLI